MIVADDPVNPPGTKNKNDTVIHRVRRDFAFCSEKYFAVLIFGSYARGEEEHYSDIDICIVSKNRKEYSTILYDEIYPNVRMDRYDVVIFEGCSESIRSAIAKDYIIVFCKNPEELGDYLKSCQDFKPLVKNREKILDELRSVVDAI